MRKTLRKTRQQQLFFFVQRRIQKIHTQKTSSFVWRYFFVHRFQIYWLTFDESRRRISSNEAYAAIMRSMSIANICERSFWYLNQEKLTVYFKQIFKFFYIRRLHCFSSFLSLLHFLSLKHYVTNITNFLSWNVATISRLLFSFCKNLSFHTKKIVSITNLWSNERFI